MAPKRGDVVAEPAADFLDADKRSRGKRIHMVAYIKSKAAPVGDDTARQLAKIPVIGRPRWKRRAYNTVRRRRPGGNPEADTLARRRSLSGAGIWPAFYAPCPVFVEVSSR